MHKSGLVFPSPSVRSLSMRMWFEARLDLVIIPKEMKLTRKPYTLIYYGSANSAKCPPTTGRAVNWRPPG